MSRGPRAEEREALGLALASGLPYAGLAGREPAEGLVAPALQRELGIVPVGVGPRGELLVAAADPHVDLARLGRPALLSIAPRDEVEALLAAAGRPPDPERQPQPEAGREPVPTAADAPEAEPPEAGAPGPDAPRPERDEPTPPGEAARRRPPPLVGLDSPPHSVAPPRRHPRRRAVALAGALLVLAGGGAAAGVLASRDDERPPPARPTVVAVATRELGRNLLATLPVPTAPRPRALALRRACDGGALAAVVTRPLTDAPCALTALAEATTRATVILAPGGGCISARRARRLVDQFGGRAAPEPQPADLLPVLVRPRAGADCIGPTGDALRGGSFPLADVAVLAARPDRTSHPAVRDAARALPRAERTAPVTTLIVTRALAPLSP